MTLQTSGAITFGNVQTEMLGTNPISLSEYYDAVDDIPASGAISMSNFYGKQRKGKLHAIGLWKSSLQTGKSTGVSSLTNVGTADYRWNYSTTLSTGANPCLHQGTDNRQSGYGQGTSVLFFYKYNYEQNTGSTRCKHRYNAYRAGNDWSINHMSMISWSHYD
jgi:hypothetical protein